MSRIPIIPKAEVFSSEDQEVRTLRILSFEFQLVHFPEYSDPNWTVTIPPRSFRAMKIQISHENGVPTKRHYWLDSKRLTNALHFLLVDKGSMPRTYRILKHGIPPKSHYVVTIEP